MRLLLAALLLCPGLAHAQMMGWWGEAAAGGGGSLALESVTCTTMADYRAQSNQQSLASISVPANSAAVVLSAYDPDSATNTTTVTSTSLTWTQQAIHHVSTNLKVTVWTAPNSGSSTTETVTVASSSNARQGAFCVAVLSGADLTALSNAVATTGTPGTSTTFGLSVTRAKSSSYLFGVAMSHNWAGSATPDSGYTETLDVADGDRGVDVYTLRSTSAGSGTATIGGTWASTQVTVMAAIEIG